MNGINALVRRQLELACSLSVLHYGGCSGKAICKPGGGASPDLICQCHHLGLASLWIINACCLNHPVYGILVILGLKPR